MSGFACSELIQSIQSPYDRIYSITRYFSDNGSQNIPVCFMQAIGAYPGGYGTYRWSDGTSSINVLGDLPRLTGEQEHLGTISISRMNATIVNPITGEEIHMDYNFQQADHSKLHVHQGNSPGIPLDYTETQKLLNSFKKHFSENFRSMLESKVTTNFTVRGWEEEQE